MKVYAIDRETLMNVVLPSSTTLQKVFDKYASADKEGNKLMTHRDFLASMNMLEEIGDTSRYIHIYLSTYFHIPLLLSIPLAFH